MRSYEQVLDGQWIAPARHGYRQACCDCGLVHRVDFRVKQGRIQLRAFRDAPGTKAVRQWMQRSPSGSKGDNNA